MRRKYARQYHVQAPKAVICLILIWGGSRFAARRDDNDKLIRDSFILSVLHLFIFQARGVLTGEDDDFDD